MVSLSNLVIKCSFQLCQQILQTDPNQNLKYNVDGSIWKMERVMQESKDNA